MFWRKLVSAGCALGLLAAASWLPARASGRATSTATAQVGGIPADLSRDAIAPPDVRPAAPAGPVQAVSGFFWALSEATAGQPSASAASPASSATEATASGEAGAPAPPDQSAPGEAFARAYAYLTPGGRDALPFAAFARQWSAIRRLDLLAALPAGAPEGDPRAERVFVEVRMLGTGCGEAARVCLWYAAGFYTTEPTSTGWRLRGGSLTPERFGIDRPEGAGTPEAVATASATTVATRLGRAGAKEAPRVHVSPGADHQASAVVHLGGDRYDVRLYQLVDGDWVAVRLTR